LWKRRRKEAKLGLKQEIKRPETKLGWNITQRYWLKKKKKRKEKA